MTTERNRFARRLAEDTLVTLLHELRDHDLPLIVMGGLVPEILAQDQHPPVPVHLGTTDVDLLIDPGCEVQADLGALEELLPRLGFIPDKASGGWRWVGGPFVAPVRLEFLCELDDWPAGAVRPPGCEVLAAANLRGTGYVREDWEMVDLTGSLPDGETATVQARVAGLGGYLLAKAVALRERALEKDYYDFAYVLLFNRLGGPAQAARLLLEGPLAGRLAGLQTVWRELAERFETADRVGPVGYAEQALVVDPTADPARLRQDAAVAVREFLEVLGVV